MNRLLIALMVCITWAGAAFGQTTVNLSVTDTPDNQTWNNGTWSVQLIPGPGNLDQTRNFTLLSGGGSLGNQSGSLSSTGTASMSLPANVNIGPVGTKWQFTVCSQQGTACSISNVTVVTSSPQAVALTPSSIRVSASPNLPPIVVYTTTEISSASIGSQITVVGSTPSTPSLQNCTVTSGSACITWVTVGGAPGGSSTQVQYNNSGAFGGAAGFTYSASASPTVGITGQASGANALTVTGGSLGAGSALTLLNGGNGANRLLNFDNGTCFLDTNGNVSLANTCNINGVPTIGTGSNCSSSAAPAVCGSAMAGSVVVAAAATTVTVNTTAVTANSQILLTRDDSLGTKLTVTCNTVTVMGEMKVSARTAATSFVITVQTAPVTNPGCISYMIIN